MLKDGDMVLLYHEKNNFMIPYKDNQSFSTHKGSVKMEGDLDYGDRILSNTGEEFYLLRPSLTDWMMKVRRATTIIYPKDAGTLIMEMGIQNGSRVIEIGSGSGSFTTLLSRIVGDQGRIYSFERKEENQIQARKNLEKLGCPENVEFLLGDPAETEQGFGLTDIDAVFLDVPAPWLLVPAAQRALKGGGHLGSLSPCIEQVMQTVDAMEENGFVRVRTQENLVRNIRVKRGLTRPYDRMIGHTAYLLFAQKINQGATE